MHSRRAPRGHRSFSAPLELCLAASQPAPDLIFSIRTEHQLVQHIECRLLCRGLVGPDTPEPVWEHSSFTKKRTACSMKRSRLTPFSFGDKFQRTVKPAHAGLALMFAGPLSSLPVSANPLASLNNSLSSIIISRIRLNEAMLRH